MKSITVTPNIQIVIDTNQYIVQQLHKINPRNSPRFDPDKHDPTIREEWKDEGYYGLTDRGLQAAIKSVILKESGVSGEEKLSLKEYLKELKEISTKVLYEVNKNIAQ